MEEKASLLIVDDERGPAESLRMIFKPFYNVFIAGGGVQALEIVRSTPIDVVTLDLRMPNMSGIEVMERIKEYDPDIEVIIITGYSSLESALRGIKFGVFDYISKPFDVPQICDLVRRAVARRQTRLRDRRIKENFLANLSHELRTPLSAIIGYTSILAEELQSSISPDQVAVLGRIQANSEELLNLVESVLLLNALEAGEVTLNLHPFDLCETVQRAVSKFESVAHEKGLELHTEFDSPRLIAFSDEDKVERILWAFLDNAVKFTPCGVLTVSLRATDLGNAELEIRDTGIGMHRNDIELALEGLSQADPSDRRRYRGLGLGLRIATKLVRMLDGNIHVSSAANHGTQVVLNLPLHLQRGMEQLHP